MSSSFGSGYAVCLRQFLWHEPRLGEYVTEYARLAARGIRADLWTERAAVEMWANGAADHLLDLRRPKRGVADEDWRRAERLAGLLYAARMMGLRRGAPDTEHAMRRLLEEATALLGRYAETLGQPFPETFEAAWELDLAGGAEPERGDIATCVEPLLPRGVPG